MPWDSCGVRGHPQDDPTPSDILGPADRGGQVLRILWTTVQRVPQSDSRRPPVTHSIQHVCVCRHMTLGDSGVANRGGHGGTWPINTWLRAIFLCQQWPRCFNPTGEATEGVRRPHQPLWPGWPQDEYAEDGEYVLPAMPCAWQDVGGGVWEADYGDRTKLLGATAEEGVITGVRSGFWVRVADDAPSDPARCGLGGLHAF